MGISVDSSDLDVLHGKLRAHWAGLAALLTQAKLPNAFRCHVERELLELGAVDVRELAAAEWSELASVRALRPLELRRLLAATQLLLQA